MAEPAHGLKRSMRVLFLDAIRDKIRDGQVANRPINVALAVTADGERDILGLWAGDRGCREGCGTPTGSFRSVPAAAQGYALLV
jgi:hypothetical protein